MDFIGAIAVCIEIDVQALNEEIALSVARRYRFDGGVVVELVGRDL